MAARGLMRLTWFNVKKVKLNVPKISVQLVQNGDRKRSVIDQKELHTLVQPCQAAILNREIPIKHYRTITSSSYEEKENIEDDMDNHGDFDNYNISSVSQDKLIKMGIKKLFPVQYETFQHTLEGRDVIVQARTGTGKTLSFALPIVEGLQQNTTRFQESCRKPAVIVLTPTRELAVQVTRVFEELSTSVKVTNVYGGVPIEKQISTIQRGVDVIVGTPGRVSDLMRRNALDLSQLKHVILDEVDRMLDMGFDVQVEEIIKDSYQAEEKPQTMLYSATMPHWVRKAAKQYLSDDFKLISLVDKQGEQTAVTVKQYILKCKDMQRPSLISYFMKKFVSKGGRAIIFCETKLEVDEIAKYDLGWKSKAFHGDISQSSRNIILDEFRKGHFEVLATTDVAARGLDIPDIDLVIQTRPPKDSDYYIHRVGRTGRAGKSGVSIMLYTSGYISFMKNCEKQANINFQELSPPTLNDLFAICAKSVTSDVLSVPDDLSEKFTMVADMLIKEKGAEKMLAAALAVASNANLYYNRSLITYQEGYTTLQYTSGDATERMGLKGKLYKYFDMLNISYKNIHFVRRSKDLVFDVKVDDVATFLTGFDEVKSDDSETVERINDLPDIEEGYDNTQKRRYGGYNKGYSPGNRNSYGNRQYNPGKYENNSRLHEAFGNKSRYGHRDMYNNKRNSYDNDGGYRSNFQNRYNKRSHDKQDFSDDEFF